MKSLLFRVGEYNSILSRACREGWLRPLMAAHLTPCTPQQAINLLGALVPRRTKVFFRENSCSRTSDRSGFYRITLSSKPGIGIRRLHVGIVLHEATHILDHQRQRSFGHGQSFCQHLRRVFETTLWRSVVPTRSFAEIYDRHRGPYCLLVSHQGKKEQTTERLGGPFSPAEAHDKAVALVADASNDVIDVYAYSLTEGQFVGAIYSRGQKYSTWEEQQHERMELSDQRQSAALVQGREEPVRPVDDPGDDSLPVEAVSGSGPVRSVSEEAPTKPRTKPRAAAAGNRQPPPRRVALALQIGAAEGWPKSPAAQAVRTLLAERTALTPGQIVEAIGAQLTGLGVEHPTSLISRLKQGGFLEVQSGC